MTFTDDDLKRLTERFLYQDRVNNGWFQGPEEIKIFTALLARLETAERGMFSLETIIRWMRQEERYKTLSAADLVWLQGAEIGLNAWHKAVGK